MLFLYPKNTTDFTNNGDPIHHSYDEHVIRDDGFYLTFNLLLDKEEGYKKVKKEMIIGANTPDGPNQFRVYDVKKKNTHVEVTAVQLMYDFDNKEVNPFSVKNATGNQVITKFRSSFKSALGQFTMDSSVNEVHDFTTNEVEDDTPSHNALEVLNRITSRWDSELMLNGFDIRMIKRLGQKTDALLYEKKNISEFEDSSSVSGMATRIHATSKFTPEGKENEVTLSVTVDSPLINEYAQIYEKSFVNNECRTEAELIAWVKLKYSTENIDKPSRSITVATNIIDGTEINYGDDLVLKYLVHDVDEVIRCVGYDYDPIRKTYYSVTLGDWKDSFLNTVTSNIVDSTNKQLNQLKKNVTYVLMSANGKNRTAYGPNPVPNPINGDMWYYYESDRPNDVELRIFNDGFWEPINFATKEEVEGALAEAEEAKQEAIESYNNAITDAVTYTNTKAQEFDTKLLAVNQEVANVTQSANTAVTQANKAIEDAGFAKADAASARQAASAASGSALEAIGLAQQVNTNVNTLTSNYDTLTQTVSAKAEKSTVEVVSGIVNRHTNEISANAEAVKLRLTSAQVDNLVSQKGYATTNQLTATSGSLTSLITGVQTNLDNLEISGRNLLLDSKRIEITPTTRYITKRLSKPILPNQKYTISIGYREYVTKTVSHDSVLVSPRDDRGGTTTSIGDAVGSAYTVPIGGSVTSEFTNTNQVIDTILFYSADQNIVSGNKEFYFDVKVAEGEKNTGWTPAPEDQATKTEFTEINQTVNSLSSRVGNSEGQLSALELRVTGVQTTVASKADKSQITQLSGQITSVVTDFDNLEIGGRNILLNSEIIGVLSNNNSSYPVNQETLSEGSIKFRRITAHPTIGNGYISLYESIRGTDIADRNWKGKDIVFSLRFRTNHAVNFMFRPWLVVNGTNIYGEYREVMGNGNWREVSFTFKNFSSDISSTDIIRFMPSISVNMRGYYLDLRGYQIEFGNKATDWSPAPEDMATSTQLTQLSDSLNARIVEKGQVVAQFNMDNGTTLIQNKKLLLDANTYIMGTTFANDVKAKSLEAVYADIATLKTKVLTADVITSTMLKSDTALIDKIFATDANVNRLTAKTAFINSVKAIDIAADRITTGTLNAANVNIINLSASKIVASSLSALTTNTGALNVTDWLTFSTDNKGIRATYDFGDQLGGSFDPRWFVGNYTLGYRYMKFLADVYTVSASGGRGNYGYYSETFYGPDYFKLRQYNNSTMTRLLTRIDMRSEYISLSTSFDETKIYLNANGDTFFAGNMQVNGDLWIGNLKALKAYYVQAPETANNLYINGGRNDLGSMRFGVDGSTLNGGRLISSDSVYHRTYSSASNVIVWDTGTIGRSVSARKYKLNIESNNLLETALKTLSISPSSWHDKAEVESIAKTMSNGTEQELDPNFRLKRHYGFVADEFHEKGATEVVMYDSKGEVEGLAYDRISMYHHELIKDLYHKIEQQENKIKELERKTA